MNKLLGRITGRKSLRTDFMLAFFLTMMLILALALLVDYTFVYSRNSRALRKETRELTAKAAETLQRPLWQYDVEFIRTYAETLLANHSLVRVSVFDERRKRLVHMEAAGRSGKGKDTTWLLTESVDFKGKSMGRIEILYTDAEIWSMSSKMLVSDVAMIVAGMVPLLGIAWLLITRQVLIPLNIMEKSFHKISAGDYTRRVTLAKANELARIAREFNAMVEQVESREKKIRESEIKYRNLVEGSSDIIFNADLDGRLIFINRNFEKWTGLDAGHFISRTFTRLFAAPETSEFSLDALRQDLDSGRHLLYELGLMTRDKGLIPVELSISAQADIQGRPSGFTGIARDITNRKDLEARLRQSQKMEAIGTFAGGIAHDFNNIVGGILGYAEMIEIFDTDRNPQLKSRIHHVLKGASRAKALINQILTFSRQSDQQKRPVPMDILMKETMTFLRASIPSTITIWEDLNHPGCVVWAEDTAIQQVLMNLCANAAHAMQENGGYLAVQLARTRLDRETAGRLSLDGPGRYVKVSVSDSGTGIDPAIAERIFDPFFTTKTTGEGTGMGLAVVHGIVRQLNGCISVDSTPGKGTAFHLHLPLFEPGPGPAGPDRQGLAGLPGRSSGQGSHPGGTGRGRGRILFIDDEAELVSFSKEILEHMGYEVTGMTASVDARQAFMADPGAFDLVITDQTMPSITGYELALEFLGARQDLPIALCTGFSLPNLQKKAMDAGIAAFVKKPIGARQLSDLVNRLMGGTGTGPARPGQLS